LLPQVAIDWNWNAEQFLSQTCVKAGLPPDQWIHNKDTDVFKFQAELFEETEPNGQVIQRFLK
jgi:uncharacterized protein (TIGR00296 family)